MRACWRSDGSDGRGVRDHRHTRGRGPLGGVGGLGEEESVEEGVEGKCNQARRADRDVVLSGSVGGARRQQKVHSGTHFGDHAIAIQQSRGGYRATVGSGGLERGRDGRGWLWAAHRLGGRAAKLQLRRALASGYERVNDVRNVRARTAAARRAGGANSTGLRVCGWVSQACARGGQWSHNHAVLREA